MNPKVPENPEQALSMLSDGARVMSRAHHRLRRALDDAGIEDADVRTIMGVARDRSRRMDWLAMNVLRDRLRTSDEIDAVMKTFTAYTAAREIVAHMCDADPGIFELPESTERT